MLATAASGLVGDYLYIGDQGDPNDASDDSVQQFDAATGQYLGKFVAPGSLVGPRGLVFSNPDTLLVVNQNANQPFAGEVLRYNAKTGAELTPLVPAFLASGAANPNAPFAPRGVVVRDNVVYVADFAEGSPTGRIAKFNATSGVFLGNLVPTNFRSAFRPRGLVFGPDGQLYVTVFNPDGFTNDDPAGYILRFNTASGVSQIVAANNGDGIHQASEVANLQNPEGLVFGPDGRIYVTTSRWNANSRVLIINPSTGTKLDEILLDPASRPDQPTRAGAQALAFGPNGRLYLPVQLTTLNDGSVAGAVWTYDPATKSLNKSFVVPSAFSPALASPWYLTFGRTDPATMNYLALSAPVLAGIETSGLSYKANDPATVMTMSITASDADSTALKSAVVAISVGYQNGQDILSFTNTASISGVWNAATATLTLSGSDTVAQYQQALRSVKYRNSNGTPNLGSRTVSFHVSDGTLDSNLLTRNVAVVANSSSDGILYVGDQGDPSDPNDDRIVRLDAATGAPLGTWQVPGRLIGPRGLVFSNPDTLLVVNQNANQPFAGEVLRYNAKTGAELTPLVPAFLASGAANSNAPFAPRGIVVRDNVVYVADFAEGSPTGRIAKFNAISGAFIGNLVPKNFSGDFRPRGLVFDPDGQLYVSLFGLSPSGAHNPLAGYVLRINPATGQSVTVAANDGDGIQESGENTNLHGPEGLAFGPDGRLYVTSFRADSNDTSKILVLDPATGAQKDVITLDQAGQPAAYAEAIVFGPHGRLFAPITGDGPATGSVRRYDVANKTFEVLVASAAQGGPLKQPWYVASSYSRQDTLAYDQDHSPWHNTANPLDVDGRDGVAARDVLIVINYINSHPGVSSLPVPSTVGPPYYDVAPGGFVSALDALLIINYINGRSNTSNAVAAEGEVPFGDSPASFLSTVLFPDPVNSAAPPLLPSQIIGTQLATAGEAADEPHDETYWTGGQVDEFDVLWNALDDVLPDLAADINRAVMDGWQAGDCG